MALLSAEYDRLPLWSVVFLIVGILLGVKCPASSWIYLADFSVYSIAASLLLLYISKFVWFYVFSVILGFITVQFNGIHGELYVNKQYLHKHLKCVNIVGNIASIEDTNKANMQRIVIQNVKIAKYPFIKTISVVCHKTKINNISVNDTVFARCNLYPLKTNVIPGTFNEKQYNSLISIDAKGIALYMRLLQKFERSSISRIRHHISCIIDKKLSTNAACITKALLIGNRSSIPSIMKQSFTDSGVSHVLAISGLHMSIIVAMVFKVAVIILLYLSNIFMRLNANKYASYISIAVSYVYLMIAGFPPSAVRAFIMATMCLLSKAYGRTAISMRNVVMSAFATLILHPASLFLVGFQLSYLSVIAIVSLYECVGPKIIFKNRLLSYIVASICISVATSIAIFPIIVSTFNHHSVASIMSNMIVVPLMSVVIAPIGIMALCTHWFTDIFVRVYDVMVHILIALITKLSSMPFAKVTLKAMHNTSLIMSIVGILIFAFCITKIRLLGAVLFAASIVIYCCEQNPDIVMYGNSNIIAVNKYNTLHITSLQSCRLQTYNLLKYIGYNSAIKRIYYESNYRKNARYIYFDKQKRNIKAIYCAKSSRHPFCWSWLAKCKYINDINTQEMLALYHSV